MLMRILFSARFYARRVKPQPLRRPEGAEKVKFTEEELSQLGAAAKAERLTVAQAFQEKYSKSFQNF